jgi:hypothetical protein
MKKRHDKFLGSVVTVRIEKLLRVLQITMTGSCVTKTAVVAHGQIGIENVGRIMELKCVFWGLVMLFLENDL